jgi:predicted RNA-binding Zn-ribbon protein involved in translation (DUF1610 family)
MTNDSTYSGSDGTSTCFACGSEYAVKIKARTIGGDYRCRDCGAIFDDSRSAGR